jgi:phage recombination protein Bet
MTATVMDTAAPLVTPDQLDLIKRTIANGATDAELKLFLYDCSRRGVHPLDRLIYFTKRKGRYVPVTSIDYMRSQAAATGEMAGSDDAVFRIEEGWPQAATVTVYRLTAGQRFPYTATARFEEYKPEADSMWKQMPFTMLAKCAEALALRKAFPKQLSGIYAQEELNGSSDDMADRPDREAGERMGVRAMSATTVSAVPAVDLPHGYRLLQDYSEKDGWHYIKVLAADGTVEHGRTKLSAIGYQLRQAYHQQQPVALDMSVATKKTDPRWINSVQVYSKPLDAEAAEATRLDTENPPF